MLNFLRNIVTSIWGVFLAVFFALPLLSIFTMDRMANGEVVDASKVPPILIGVCAFFVVSSLLSLFLVKLLVVPAIASLGAGVVALTGIGGLELPQPANADAALLCFAVAAFSFFLIFVDHYYVQKSKRARAEKKAAKTAVKEF